MPNDRDRRAGVAPLLDRVDERALIDQIVGMVRDGLSGVQVFTGDAGMGKTRLLEYAVEAAPELDSIWIVGVETERELGYAGLHRFLRPLLVRREGLPERQRTALESAFGLGGDAPADRFLVGLATLTLLADAAAERGLVCVVDDAQWIDRESLEALTFAARRFEADRVALLFGVRDPEMVAGVFDGLPGLAIAGLPDDASLELLSTRATTSIDSEVARQVVVATSGCPLALIELATGSGPDQLLGGLRVGEALPIGRQLEEHFLRQVRGLAAAAQMFLLVAAAEWSGDLVVVRRAARSLGVDDDAEDAAIASGLISVGSTVEFRHPLVRAAVYGGASRSVRSAVHRTLAALVDRTDPERHLRHLAAAAREPDESLARRLEQAAERSWRRGGYAAETSFLVEAAHLTPGRSERSRRLLRAAGAALTAGLTRQAAALLEQAQLGLDDPLLVIDAMRLDGRLRVPLGDAPTAPARLLAAARALAPIDASQMRDALFEALDACIVAQHLMSGVTPHDVARAALASREAAVDPPALSDLILDGLAFAVLSDYASAVPILRRVTEAMRDGSVVSRDDLVRWVHPCLVISVEVYDDVAYDAWVTQVEQRARDVGAVQVLQIALLARAPREMRAGRFRAAELTYDEAAELSPLVGVPREFHELLKVEISAWRGREAETRAAAARLQELATAVGAAAAVTVAHLSLATLELGSGRYAAALAAIEPVVSVQHVGWTCLALPIAIEAASRSGDRDRAARYLADLDARTSAAGTDWGRGQLARCRALVARDAEGDVEGAAETEALHREAIARLRATSVATELAQARLAYGEWLRRQRRGIDARAQLRAAHDAFATMGAEGFAARAREELAATGENVPRRAAGPVLELTPQEALAARLAATGVTNAEIATRMFVSAHTVDYHLRKVYRKLGIGSRRQLAHALDARRLPGTAPGA